MAERQRHKPSTSGACDDADLMEIDQVMVVLDTPDRVSKQPKNMCKTSNSTESSSRNSGLVNRVSKERKNRLFGESVHAKGMFFHPGDDLARSQGGSSAAVSASFRDASVSGVAGKNFKHKNRLPHKHQHLLDEEATRSSFTGRSGASSCHHFKGNEDPFVVESGGIIKSSSKSTRDDLGTRKMNRGHWLSNNMVSLDTAGASFKSTGNDNKGKLKVGHDIPSHDDVPSVEVIDNIRLNRSDHDPGKGPFVSPHSSRAPITIARKRLVRNGCISPHNIEKAKKGETSGIGSENAECGAVSGRSEPVIYVNEVNSKQNDACRAKGKGLLIYDSSSKENGGRKIEIRNYPDAQNKGKFPENDCVLVQENSGKSNKIDLGTSSFSSALLEQKPVLNEGHLHTPSSSIKRLRKHGFSGSPGKRTELICLSSGGEPSTRKSSRDHGGLRQRESGSSKAVEDFSTEVRGSSSQTENDSEARAKQLHADEMLARELQEQLYNEIPEFTHEERFPSLQGDEQQEHSVQPTSSRSYRTHDIVGVPPTNRSRAHQSLRSRLFRRGGAARFPRSNVPRLRSNFYRHPRGRELLFPSDMDLDMRMDLLESLEAVVNDDIRMVNQLLDSDREFGENDYEMLLALDENNHAHLGASVAQITNLPESTVHNDNCEACSICLETPAIGDTIRHLPCLHKFHKDCIDPWLRRRRTCPVCKSDI